MLPVFAALSSVAALRYVMYFRYYYYLVIFICYAIRQPYIGLTHNTHVSQMEVKKTAKGYTCRKIKQLKQVM